MRKLSLSCTFINQRYCIGTFAGFIIIIIPVYFRIYCNRDWKEVKTFTFTEGAKGNGEVIFDEPVTADRMKVEVRDKSAPPSLYCTGDLKDVALQSAFMIL